MNSCMTATSPLILGVHLPFFARQTEVLAFDVVSIKRAPPDSRDRSIYNFPGRLTMGNLGVKSLIASAYDVLQSQISGAPSWIDSELYDIDARCEELQSLSAAEIDRRNMARLRALLESRFHLKIHGEAREWQTYVLVTGTWAGKLGSTQRTIERYRRTGNQGHTEWEGASMDDLARYLALQLQRPVINQTGIEGRLTLSWTSKVQTRLQDKRHGRLCSRKAPVEFPVVDHVERPSGN